MVARRSQAFTTEDWNGFWGLDARYYARRSDGACFAIDGAATVFDLAGASPSSTHAERVAALPRVGRYQLRMLVARPIPPASRSEIAAVEPGAARRAAPRLFACGVRRPLSR